MSVTADLSLDYAAWEAVDDLSGLVDRSIAAACGEVEAELPAEAEVSCLFCDDATMRSLNAQWRGIDKATNVLSFPLAADGPDEANRMLGDIVLAFETVETEAGNLGKPLETHLAHLIIHGFLHLLGYDHEDEAEAEAMERLESRAMLRLGLADPYSEQPAADGP